MSVYDYVEAGFRVFPLWQLSGSVCGCGDGECQAAGKHPRLSNWQHTPHWSDEQLEVMESTGQLATGFGVCVDNHLVIDIDPRNGGFESYEKLKKDTGIDFEKQSGFVVSTGGGGLHIYFSIDEHIALVSHAKDYAGIDFKSSGYVVGYGSLHKSGNEYERKKGFPQDLTETPDKLIELLKKPDRVRAYVGNSEYMDVSESEILEMLSFINPDCSYDQWITIGMGIHDATGGAGVGIWDEWSAKGVKYDKDVIDRHWQSFGKCSNPVTLGSIIHYAEEGGWKQKIILLDTCIEENEANGLPFSIDNVDLLRPPGLVGDVTKWINSQCRFPVERLAVGAAFNVVGNAAGMRNCDELDDITMNSIILCIAGSGIGKESVLQAATDIFIDVGISGAVHGTIKSEQELTRNIIRHQASFYLVDELGYLLQKIENARKKGGASYLDGVIGQIMSMYSKASGYYLVSGDLKDAMRQELLRELSQCEKKVEENEDKDGRFRSKAEALRTRIIPAVDTGIERPFFSMLGFTTPVSFDEIVTGENATNGFISRCWLVREHETNPKRKKKFKKAPTDKRLTATLKMLAHGCISDDRVERVEWYGERMKIATTKEAEAMLDAIADWFEEEGDKQKAATGLEAVVRRGYELVAKLSIILAAGGRLREPEHVRWAFAAVLADIREKLRLAQTNMLTNSKDVNDASTVLRNKIIDAVGTDNGEPISVIKRRVGRKFNESDVESMVARMVSIGLIEEIQKDTGRRPSVRYKAR